jgi:hypothetical protein
MATYELTKGAKNISYQRVGESLGKKHYRGFFLVDEKGQVSPKLLQAFVDFGLEVGANQSLRQAGDLAPNGETLVNTGFRQQAEKTDLFTQTNNFSDSEVKELEKDGKGIASEMSTSSSEMSTSSIEQSVSQAGDLAPNGETLATAGFRQQAGKTDLSTQTNNFSDSGVKELEKDGVDISAVGETQDLSQLKPGDKAMYKSLQFLVKLNDVDRKILFPECGGKFSYDECHLPCFPSFCLGELISYNGMPATYAGKNDNNWEVIIIPQGYTKQMVVNIDECSKL